MTAIAMNRSLGLSLTTVAMMVGICVIWAANAVLLRYAVGPEGLPPVLLAAGRFGMAALLLLPFLRRKQAHLARVVVIGLLMGAGHFAFLMLGYAQLDASTAALVLQIVPVATGLLAMISGTEPFNLPRLGLIAIATVAVCFAIGGNGLAAVNVTGVLLIVISALSMAVGSVLLAAGCNARPIELQAWTSLASALVLLPLGMVLEPTGFADMAANPWLTVATIALPAVVVTIFAHTLFYALLQRNPASLLVPLTLLFPIFTVVFGITFLGEMVAPSFWIGGGVALFAVLRLASKRKPA